MDFIDGDEPPCGDGQRGKLVGGQVHVPECGLNAPVGEHVRQGGRGLRRARIRHGCILGMVGKKVKPFP